MRSQIQDQTPEQFDMPMNESQTTASAWTPAQPLPLNRLRGFQHRSVDGKIRRGVAYDRANFFYTVCRATANLPRSLSQLKAEGLEPSTYGLKVRCSTS